MKKPGIIVLLILCCFLVLSCVQAKQFNTRAFYYWKSNFNLSPYELTILKRSGIERIYVNVLDLGIRDDGIAVLRSIKNLKNISNDIKIIPVVFISQEVLSGLGEKELKMLAVKLPGEIKKLAFAVSYDEVQIDYDWTPSTRYNYFKLLNLIKKQLPDQVGLSVTIRLHQIKYRETTGIPSVEKAVLMCYNNGRTDDICSDWICDNKELRKYLRKGNYPIPLSFAIPAYETSSIITTDGTRIAGDSISNDQIREYGLKKYCNNTYTAYKYCFINGAAVNSGDMVKIDRLRLNEIKKTVRIIRDFNSVKTGELIIFSLDENSLRKVFGADENIKNIYNY